MVIGVCRRTADLVANLGPGLPGPKTCNWPDVGARGAAAAPAVVSGRGTPRGRAEPAGARPAVESGMLHPELQTLLTAIDAAEADATTLAAGLTDAQANWQPKAGAGW